MKQDESKFDRRIQERNLRLGVITEKELEDYLRKLPDATEKITTLGEPPTTDKVEETTPAEEDTTH